MEFFIKQIKKLEMNKYKIYTALWILFGVLMVLDVVDIFATNSEWSLEYFFFILFITFLILGDQERARISQQQ